MEEELGNGGISAAPADASSCQAAHQGEARPSAAQQSQPSKSINSESPKQPDHVASESIEINPPTQSPPMSRDNSNSLENPAKDDPVTGPSPYGTRSRNRSAPRPNYADEPDIEYEIVKPVNEAFSDKRSASSEAAPKSGLPTAAALRLNTSTTNGTRLSSASTTHDNTASPPSVHAQSDKKKRKANAVDSSAAHGNGIPGTSQFSATPSSASDHPLPKKRKTGDGLGDSGPTPMRKASLTHLPRHGSRESAIVTFEKSGGIVRNGKLEADDGCVYSIEDNVFLVCEPPGDPYYLARLMDFRRANQEDAKSPVVALLVNWYYRPKDIGKYSADARYLFASMQSDECPITSLRGKCHVKHRSEIKDLDDFRKQRDTFWFNQLYDRYIRRPYEVISAKSVINVPEKVKKAINERWKYLVVEAARQKELTSAIKLCKRCQTYCAPNDSVDCGVCRETWHMACVRPPMIKKPTRGFAWSCGPCSKAQERKLEARHAAVLPDSGADRDEDMIDEEEEEAGTITRGKENVMDLDIADEVPSDRQGTTLAKLWPWRYLGVHCRVEDVLQYDDQAIYPRASSRLGPRHQANTVAWYGRPVEYVKSTDTKKKTAKGANHKKDAKQANAGAMEAEKLEKLNRPKWLQDEPPGYIARGEDHDSKDPKCTATRLFVMPTEADEIHSVDSFMEKARSAANDWGLVTISKAGDPQISTNYLDKALHVLFKNEFNEAKAMAQLQAEHSAKHLGNVELTKEELKKFEDGVVKHGSEMRMVRRLIKSRTTGELVRFYYTWKFTQRGIEARNRHEGRRGTKKRAEASWTEIADDEDDSAFDNDKIFVKKRKFCCKFCATQHSRQWRRAPSVQPGATVLADPKGNPKDKANQLIVGLCMRCAVLWRKYGIKYDDPEEIAKSIQLPGGRAWKRRIDEEMLREVVHANEAAGVPTMPAAAAAAAAIGVVVTVPVEPKKKQLKVIGDKEGTPATDPPKKKIAAAPPPRPPTPPVEAAEPELRDLPCAVCRWADFGGTSKDEKIICNECKLTVHRNCYGIATQANPSKWVCDTCLNDKDQRYSLNYKCALCPVHDRVIEFVEPPKVTHKKKTDRDREKERLEKDWALRMEQEIVKKQRQKGRPLYPREAVKVTASNNWIHLTCAIWTPEMRFADTIRMEGIEGMGTVVTTPSRMDPVCKVCKTIDGACVACHQCHATFHVGCAHEAGYRFGFDVTPVKGSRKDVMNSITLGNETGWAAPVIFCKEHTSTKTIVHDMSEVVVDDEGSGINALQTFVRTYKQADLTLTGTARKANLLNQTTKAVSQSAVAGGPGRRMSLVNGGTKTNGTTPPETGLEANGNASMVLEHKSESRKCSTCDIKTSLRWHHQGSHTWQCHKCNVRQKLGVSLRQWVPLDKSEPTSDLQSKADFFELTAPPPPTPPAHAPTLDTALALGTLTNGSTSSSLLSWASKRWRL